MFQKKLYLCTRQEANILMHRITKSNLQTIVAALLVSCSHQLCAQEIGVCYDTELQTDFKGNCNFANLLYLSADYSLGEHFKLSAASISTFKTRKGSLLDDLQGFSNLEADNEPFTLAVTGIGWEVNGHHSLFFGIRNVNEDYFTSDVTSLFLNSSCGIFPTLSFNMDIANYPLASMALHYCYASPSFNFLASAYNGQGYDRLKGSDNLWRITPHSDGLFFITQADWQQSNGHYFAGVAQHSGPLSGSSGTHDGSSAQTALWTYSEYSLTDRLSFIADYSHAFGHSSRCTDFFGFGGQYTWNRSALGFFSDYAKFRHESEWAAELTYKYNITSSLFLQASCQLIHHRSWLPAGMLRMSVRIPSC